MIERKFVSQNMKEFEVKKHLFEQLKRAGLSDVKLQRTPLGEKIQVFASRPGLVVGKGGGNITKLTEDLKQKFNMENPQIEIEEVSNPRANAAITSELITNSLERFGSQRFKGVGHKALTSVMEGGALGVEILISGKIPSSRAKTWRFYQGYLKKCGDISISGVDKSHQIAKLKTGVVGVSVNIMPGDTVLPDKIGLRSEPETIVEEVSTPEDLKKEMEEAEKAEEKPGEKEETNTTKKVAKKKTETTKKKTTTKKKKDDEAKPVEKKEEPKAKTTTKKKTGTKTKEKEDKK